MNIKQSFYTVIRNLFVNKIRFLQTIFTMMIGVAMIFVTCNTCRLLFGLVEDTIIPESYSLMNMYVDTKVDYKRPITINDMEKIAAKYSDYIVAVSPFVFDHTLSGNVWYGNRHFKDVCFIGVNENYLNVMPDEELVDGRFFEYMDCARERNVCVVSSDIANELMDGDALGQTLKIWGINCTVIGIKQKTGLIFDDQILLPYNNAQKITGERIEKGYSGDYFSNRFVLLANGVENIGNARRVVEQEVSEWMGEEVNADRWFLTCASNLFLYNLSKESVYTVGFELMFMAAIILVLGGVSIMNIMLASVRKRTKEIGIRKAFGATNKDIQRQFMLEAVITSLIGGLIGVVFGIILNFFLPVFITSIPVGNTGGSYYTADLDISITSWPILLALGVSVSVGIIFGTYPAKQAAKMEIVDAINSD